MVVQLTHEFQPMEIGFNNDLMLNSSEDTWYVFSVEPVCVINAEETNKVKINQVQSNESALNGSYKYGSPMARMHFPDSRTLVAIKKSYVIKSVGGKLQLNFGMTFASADVGLYVKYNSCGDMYTPCFFDVYANVCSNAAATGVTNSVYLYSVKFLNQRPRANINDSLSPSKTSNPVYSENAKTAH